MSTFPRSGLAGSTMCPLAQYCLTMFIFLYVISLFLLSTVARSLFHVTCSVISPFGSRGGVNYGGWLFSYQFGASVLCILGLITRLPAFGFSLPPSSFGPHLLYDYSLRQCCFPVFLCFLCCPSVSVFGALLERGYPPMLHTWSYKSSCPQTTVLLAHPDLKSNWERAFRPLSSPHPFMYHVPRRFCRAGPPVLHEAERRKSCRNHLVLAMSHCFQISSFLFPTSIDCPLLFPSTTVAFRLQSELTLNRQHH